AFSYTNLKGERHTIYEKNLADLRAREKKILREIEDGLDPRAAERITLNELYDKYIGQKYDLKETTKGAYIYCYDRYVRENFGKRKIATIKYSHVKEIYYSLHVVDLKKNTVMEYSAKNQVKEVMGENKNGKADQIMVGIMKATMSDEYLERGLEFTDINTVAERMTGKKIISMELLGKNVGWIRMSFIALEEENGIPVKAIITMQIIDEEKKIAESLYEKSHLDEMTGCFNRRAYNTDVTGIENDEEDKDLAYISFDVNGLKTVNDTLGHEAGDELLTGAAECMRQVYAKHGRIYRNGGDEFVGIVHADEDLIKVLCHDFDKEIGKWQGKLVKSISVSYGYVLWAEAEGKSVEEIADMADKRMYAAKDAYYKKKGIERRRT
ncbi:MAG: GGDEF domain-containing protein, partial [Eubacterium sp.]|nr:GGDEF domain-containing protein [Eubacterium sp.]